MAEGHHKRLRLLKAEITAQGGQVIDIRVSKHCKIRFLNPSGVPKLLVVSLSPSDHRNSLEVSKNIRHLMR